jgi:hypothetical protein
VVALEHEKPGQAHRTSKENQNKGKKKRPSETRASTVQHTALPRIKCKVYIKSHLPRAKCGGYLLKSQLLESRKRKAACSRPAQAVCKTASQKQSKRGWLK